MILNLTDIELRVHLGEPDEERAQIQLVYLDLTIDLKNTTASQTDDINDTICYATLYEKLQAFCDGKSFHLIEYLAQQLYNEFITQYPDIELISLTVYKNPPLKQIKTAAITIKGAYR